MRALVLTIGLLLPAGPILAHSGGLPAADQGAPAPIFKLEKVSDRVYCLFGRGGNVGLLVTEQGVLVVDDQYGDIASGIVDQIRTVTDKPIRFLVNTHYHADHTGGNPVFVKLGEIIAHETVRPRLLEFPLVINKMFPGKMQALEAEIAAIKDPADVYRDALGKDVGLMKFFLENARAFSPDTAAPPGLTYDGRMTAWLGDQPVEITHITPGHTDGDSIVHFRKENVVHMGDLLFNGMVPFIDVEGGGSAAGYLKALDWALERLPAVTRVIPGHGPVTDMAGLRHHREFLKDLHAEVEKAVKNGLSRADAARAVKLPAYSDIKPSFRSLANAVLVIYDEMRAGRPTAPR